MQGIVLLILYSFFAGFVMYNQSNNVNNNRVYFALASGYLCTHIINTYFKVALNYFNTY